MRKEETDEELLEMSPYRPLRPRELRDVISHYFKTMKPDGERNFILLLNRLVTGHKDFDSLETIDGILEFFEEMAKSIRNVPRKVALPMYGKMVLYGRNARERFEKKPEDLSVFLELFTAASEESRMNALAVFDLFAENGFPKEVAVGLIPRLIDQVYGSERPFKAYYSVRLLNRIQAQSIVSKEEFEKIVSEKVVGKTYKPIIRNDFFPEVGFFLDAV